MFIHLIIFVVINVSVKFYLETHYNFVNSFYDLSLDNESHDMALHLCCWDFTP